MTEPRARAAVSRHRQSLRRQGFVRVEVRARAQDVPLLRRVASALTDESSAPDARALLQRSFAPAAAPSLKALLAAAPLEGIDLDRPRDLGRDVEL